MNTARITRGATVFCAVALVGLVGCEKKANLSNDKEKASYAIGIQIGKSLKAQNADVDQTSLNAGLSDAISGKEPRLKVEEMQAALMKLQEQSIKNAQEAGEKNLKAGQEWLEKNKKNEGWKTTESGLQYKVEKEGTGATPKETDTVKVHYVGTLTNGEKFDSSIDRNEPATFPVNGVIPGWTEALKMMKVGSKWKLAIPPQLAYGPQGRPGIPPNSVLLFDVELLDIVQPAAAPAAPGGAPHGAAEKGGKKK